MKRNTLTSALTAAALFAGAALLLADIKTDYSHSVNFNQYHTYSWLKIDAQDPLWVDRIRRDVDAQLMAKGWMKVDSGGDAAVSAIGATHTKQTLQTFYDGLGGGWFWGAGSDLATTNTIETPVGTLMVDIFDRHSKKLIWRGTASNVLSGKVENNEKKLQKSVQEMFKNFPPKEKG